MTIRFEQATLPQLGSSDAVVIGGSFAGIAAALKLAGAGHSVTLVEPRTYLGREVTASLRPWLIAQAGPDAPELIASSLRAAARGQSINLDALKIHLEDVLLAAGVKLLYASVVIGLEHTPEGVQGVVIGNKSGRQVLGCRLVIDTSETALVARLLDAPFVPLASATAAYTRTLEYDGVGSELDLNAPLEFDGQRAVIRPGYRGRDHVFLECTLSLPFRFSSAFDMAERETLARHQTMAFASALAHQHPAFSSAYLSGASYELAGPQAPALQRDSTPSWAERFAKTRLGADVSLASLSGPVSGLWYLHEAALPLAHMDDPAAASHIGAALGQALSEQWFAASSGKAAGVPAQPAAEPSALIVREPSSPQRGHGYPRVPVTSPDIPLLREVDVLVVGGGSSGASAALIAGREHMRTVLVEMNPGLGGTGTFGGVHSYWFGRRIGFSDRLMKLVDAMHAELHHPLPKGQIPKWNIEAKSYALLREADARGVEILFNSYVIGTLMDENRVLGVVVATRMGIGLVRAKVIIDASGDGDVAAYAGAEFVYGNERDHVTMWYALAQFARPGLTRNHFTSMVDVSNVEDYTRAILAGRRRSGKEELHDHGIYVAPRESRHIRADCVLTLTDQLRHRRWDDVVNIAFSNHDVKGQSGSDWLRIGLIPPNLEVEIPYCALVPKGLENILVVGKAISATHDALPAVRMQADLENLGGVAALAAAQAVDSGRTVRDIDLRALQARLIDDAVLPADVLTRSLSPQTYSLDELRQMIADLPSFPLYLYSDMALNEIYHEAIPLVEICCAGPQVVPLLEDAYAEAEGDRRVLLAQLLALVGSPVGIDGLIEAIAPQLQGPELPARTSKILYTQLPPDHGAMPEVVYLLYSLGMTADARMLPTLQRVVELLGTAREEDFYDEMKGTFYYVDAVCYGAERLATPDTIALLQQMHHYPSFHKRMEYHAFQPDYVQERLAYLELVIGRALARAGAVEGFLTLISYLSDSRALLAEHAHTELTAITGQDHGKDVAAWSRWIEFHDETLPSAPWRPATEPMQAWSETLLTARPL